MLVTKLFSLSSKSSFPICFEVSGLKCYKSRCCFRLAPCCLSTRGERQRDTQRQRLRLWEGKETPSVLLCWPPVCFLLLCGHLTNALKKYFPQRQLRFLPVAKSIVRVHFMFFQHFQNQLYYPAFRDLHTSPVRWPLEQHGFELHLCVDFSHVVDRWCKYSAVV